MYGPFGAHSTTDQFVKRKNSIPQPSSITAVWVSTPIRKTRCSGPSNFSNRTAADFMGCFEWFSLMWHQVPHVGHMWWWVPCHLTSSLPRSSSMPPSERHHLSGRRLSSAAAGVLLSLLSTSVRTRWPRTSLPLAAAPIRQREEKGVLPLPPPVDDTVRSRRGCRWRGRPLMTERCAKRHALDPRRQNSRQ